MYMYRYYNNDELRCEMIEIPALDRLIVEVHCYTDIIWCEMTVPLIRGFVGVTLAHVTVFAFDIMERVLGLFQSSL